MLKIFLVKLYKSIHEQVRPALKQILHKGPFTLDGAGAIAVEGVDPVKNGL